MLQARPRRIHCSSSRDHYAQHGQLNQSSCVWIIETDVSDNFSAQLSYSFIEPLISAFFIFSLLGSFVYICIPTVNYLKAKKESKRCSNMSANELSIAITKPCAEREKRMTSVYLSICTAYFISVVAELIYNMFEGHPHWLAGDCDAIAGLQEFVNISMMISEFSVTLMNLLGNRIFRAGFFSFIRRTSLF